MDLLNNALDSRNKESWRELQEFEAGSEELLSNAEMYAQYLGSTLNSSTVTAKYSRENLGLSFNFVITKLYNNFFPLEAIRANRFNRGEQINDSVFPIESDLVNSSVTDSSSIKIPSSYLQAVASSNNSTIVLSKNWHCVCIKVYLYFVFLLQVM